MLQLPEIAKKAPVRSTQEKPRAPEYHAHLPAFIRALPNDADVLIPLCMSYLQAYDAFCHQADVSWLKKGDAAQEAIDSAMESICEIISYLMLHRLGKMPKIPPMWEHHYLGVVARFCINGSLSSEDYIEELARASRQILLGKDATVELG